MNLWMAPLMLEIPAHFTLAARSGSCIVSAWEFVDREIVHVCIWPGFMVVVFIDGENEIAAFSAQMWSEAVPRVTGWVGLHFVRFFLQNSSGHPGRT
jgi:hypothetical protein